MFAVRMVVTLAVLIPFVVLAPNRPVWQTFLIAVLAFGTGHVAEYAIKRGRARARSGS